MLLKKKEITRLLKRFRVTDGAGFRLDDYQPDDLAGHVVEHDEAEALLADGVSRLSALQQLLYAQSDAALLFILQGMDAAGKDGTIRHVMTGVNPQGVEISSFKQPSAEELARDFLWRVHKQVPAAGRIGIFNRSHYEDVLVCRVHPELLNQRHLSGGAAGHKFWKRRLEDIAAFEAYLGRQGIVLQKFYLHLSRDEQKRRLLARIDAPGKNWKFSAADLAERAYWNDYNEAAGAAIKATATPDAPWYVVPADHKWFAHLVVVEALIDALERLDMKPPIIPPAEMAELRAAREALEAQ